MTRAAIGALLFFVAACAAGELEPGQYRCTREPSALPQCPGEYRCGLEGFCHRLGDVGTAWLCAEKADCEAEYDCGLAKDRGHRECHDPDAGVPFACERSTDCGHGWICGLDGLCYDRTEPKPHPCGMPPSNAFCATGWRCGLDGTCHDETVASAYLCKADSDCVKPWRCGLDGRCLDPSNDALQSPAFTPATPGWMNPIYLQRRPSQLAVSEPFGQFEDKQSIGFIDQGRLVYVERIFGEVPLGVGVVFQIDAGALASPRALAAVERRIFASSADAGMLEYAFEPDGSVQILPPTPAGCELSYPYDALGHQYLRNNAGIQGAIAFSDAPAAGFAVLQPAGCNASFDFDFINPHVAPAKINDMTGFVLRLPDGGYPKDECYFMADSRGLWTSDFSNEFGTLFPFVPLDSDAFPNQSCGVPIADEILGVKVTGSDFLVIRSRPLDGGTIEAVSITSVDRLLGTTENYPCYSSRPCRNEPFSAQPLPMDAVFGPCPVCPGTRILSFFAVKDPPRTKPAVEVRCEAVPDAGIPQQTYLVRGSAASCTSTLLPGIGSLLADEVVASRASQTGVAYAGSRGQIWTGGSSQDAPPLTLDRAPVGVAEIRLLAEDAGRSVAISEGYLAMHAPGIGYVGFTPVSPDQVVSAVDGLPALVITNRKAVLTLEGVDPSKGPRTVAFAQDSSRFDPPYAGAATGITQTGAHLFVAAAERVFTADLSWSSVTPVALKNRGAAIPGLEVSSLAAVPIGSGALGAAWILAGQRLVYVVSSATNWERQELQVPMVSGAFPLEVWADVERGRLGYTDGTVFSLPSRVQIGNRLKTPQQRVVDYAAACGQAFALAPEGLFRLPSAPGVAISDWELVPTGVIGANGFEGGRIHAVGKSLHIFTAFGEAARLPISSCP